MKFGYTLLFVEDVAQTAQFYEKAFGLKIGFVAESGFYIEMDTGSTKLGFVSENFAQAGGIDFQENRMQNKAPGFELTFTTQDVMQAYATAVEAGAIPIAAPTAKPWGQTVAYVKDLSGILVSLCTPMA